MNRNQNFRRIEERAIKYQLEDVINLEDLTKVSNLEPQDFANFRNKFYRNFINGNGSLLDCHFMIKNLMNIYVVNYIKTFNDQFKEDNNLVIVGREAFSYYYSDFLSNIFTLALDSQNSYEELANFFCKGLVNKLNNELYQGKFYNFLQPSLISTEDGDYSVPPYRIGNSPYYLERVNEDNFIIFYYRIYYNEFRIYYKINTEIASERDFLHLKAWDNYSDAEDWSLDNYTFSRKNFKGEEYNDELSIERNILNLLKKPRGRKGFIPMPILYTEYEEDLYVLKIGSILSDVVTNLNKMYDLATDLIPIAGNNNNFINDLLFNRIEEVNKSYLFNFEDELNTYKSIVFFLNNKSGRAKNLEKAIVRDLLCEFENGKYTRRREDLMKILRESGIVNDENERLFDEAVFSSLCKYAKDNMRKYEEEIYEEEPFEEDFQEQPFFEEYFFK